MKQKSLMYVIALLVSSLLCCKPNPPVVKQIIPIPDTLPGKVLVDTGIISQLVAVYVNQYSEDSVVKEQTDSSIELTFYDKANKKDRFEGALASAYLAIKERTNVEGDTIVHGDMDGDGVDEIVYTVHTEGEGFGGNMWWNDIFLFKKVNGSYKLMSHQASGEVTGHESTVAPNEFAPKSIKNGLLIGTSYCYGKDDGYCCHRCTTEQ